MPQYDFSKTELVYEVDFEGYVDENGQLKFAIVPNSWRVKKSGGTLRDKLDRHFPPLVDGELPEDWQ